MPSYMCCLFLGIMQFKVNKIAMRLGLACPPGRPCQPPRTITTQPRRAQESRGEQRREECVLELAILSAHALSLSWDLGIRSNR